MDRSRSQLITASAFVVFAVLGNVLRVAAPRHVPDLALGQVSARDAGTFSDQELSREFLDVLRARDVLYRTYTADNGEPVWVFLGYFDRQKEGSQVHSPRHCYPGSGWNIEAEPRWDAPWGDGHVASLVVNDGTERRLVLYWYQMDRITEPDVLPLKIEMTRRAVLRKPQDVVFASISMPATTNLHETMARLSPLARDIHEEIDRLYRERDGYRTKS